jgi:GntR family transcriptional repressor for pyruvate dehydrogenase complex
MIESKSIRIKDNIEIHNMIISKIKDYIEYKRLGPGDKLPSERVLSEKFNVSRRNIGEAIEKLEFYSLVKSVPQSGTFVAEIGNVAINGIIEDIITLEKEDFLSLVETRIMLETKSVYLAANRRSQEDLNNIEQAFNRYKIKILTGESALQEDMLFHLSIAKATKNSTINAILLQIVPNIITAFERTRVCDKASILFEVKNHEAILLAIKNKNSKQAVKEMECHFQSLLKFCENYKSD